MKSTTLVIISIYIHSIRIHKIHRIAVTVGIRADVWILLGERVDRRETAEAGVQEPCGEVVETDLVVCL